MILLNKINIQAVNMKIMIEIIAPITTLWEEKNLEKQKNLENLKKEYLDVVVKLIDLLFRIIINGSRSNFV